MALKDTWIPQDNTMDADASVVNLIANAVIEIETSLDLGDFGGTIDHSQLENLEFENSGHTGFQAELTAEQIASINAVPDISKKVDETVGNTYTKTEVNELISRIPKMSFQVWSGTLDDLLALPAEAISDTTIYLVSKKSGTNNVYAEYIFITGVWEKLGDLDIDLTGYATKEEVEAITPKYVEETAPGTVSLAHNTHHVATVFSDPYNDLNVSLSKRITELESNFECSLYIKPYAGEEVIYKDQTGVITYFGDDCDENGVFTPQANTHYEISFKRMGSDESGNPLIIARVGAWQ